MEVSLDRLYRVAWFDPRGANPSNHTTSRAAAVCVGMDEMERVFILSSWAAFSGVDSQVDRVFRIQKKWSPTIFGVDTSATQNLWTNILSKEMDLRGIRPRFRYVALASNKRRIIETVIQPLAAAGRLFRPPEMEMKELKSEFVSFPGGVYRDSLDALAHAILLLPLKAADITSQMERDQYQRYLEMSGLSKEQIRERMAAAGKHES